MASRMRPIGDHIVISRIEAESSTPGGIVLPDGAQEKPTRGRVLAVGSGPLLRDGTRAEMEVREGDEVLFSGYAATEVEVDGEQLVVLREGDVLMVCG